MKKHFYLFTFLLLMFSNVDAGVPKVKSAFSVSSSVNVTASAVFNDTLIMAGDFTNPTSRLVQWNGSVTTNPSGGSFNGIVRTMAVFNNDLFVAGNFTSPGNRIVKWNGTTWTAFGAGANGEVRCMTQFNSELYIGGNFTSVNGVTVNNLAKFDGTTWNAIANAPNGIINTMVVYKNELYVSGTFTLAGSVSVTNIAKFDGTFWTALGTGINSSALALVEYEDTLYIGGDFTTANGITVTRLAKWDGTTWYSTGVGANASVNSLLVHNGVLYVAGNFSSINGATTNRIVAFDNKVWRVIAGGVNNTVNTMIVYKNDMYLGGLFTSAFGATVSGVSRTRMAAYEPTTLSNTIKFKNLNETSMDMYWKKGNGTKRLVTLKQDSSINHILASATPTDTTTYNANSGFALGTELGYKNYVVSNNADTNITISNLEAAKKYYYNIWEFNDYNSAGYENYSNTNVQGSFYTLAKQPDTAASNFTFSQVTQNSMRVSFTKGSGKYTMIVARKNNAITALPSDGINYNYNSNFGFGDTLSAGQFVVFYRVGNNDTSFVMSNLEMETTYHFTAYELNALDGSTPTTFNYGISSVPSAAQSTMYAAPTVNASKFTFTQVTENSMKLTVQKGNGTSRIIVCVETGALNMIVLDGASYTFNSDFAAAPELSIGNTTKIVYVGNDSSVEVTNLKPDKYYTFGIVEFNGNDLSSNFMGFYSSGFRSTLGKTTIKNADSISFSQFTTNSLRLAFKGGEGTQRIVVAKEKSAVTFVPTDTVFYGANQTFGIGAELEAGNFVVYNGPGNMCDVFNLKLGINYYFAVYEYTGSNVLAYNYAATATSGNHFALNDEPTANVSKLQVINTSSTTMTLTWERGNGNARVIVGRKAGVIYGPEDGITYIANDTFGKGTSLELGQFIVYNGTSSSVIVKGLEANTTYYFAAFEYIGGNGSENYLYANVSTLSQTTLVPEPTLAASALQITPITNGIARLSWTNGNGANRVVIVSENKEVSRIPDDEKGYSYSETFGFGEDIGGGNFVCYMGNNSGITLQGLDENKAYYAVVIEYNGSGMGSNYLTSNFVKVNNLPAKPLFVASDLQFNTYDTLAVINATWKNGDGKYRLLVANANNAVKFEPTDGVTYESNEEFGEGTVLPDGSFVVYSGDDNYARMRNIEKFTTYHFALYEFNKAEIGPPSYSDIPLQGSFSIWAVGLNNPIVNTLFNIFPNPNNGIFVLQNTAISNSKISVFNINGQEVLSGKNIEGLSELTIQLDVLPGVYFVKIENEESAAIQRLIITE